MAGCQRMTGFHGWVSEHARVSDGSRVSVGDSQVVRKWEVAVVNYQSSVCYLNINLGSVFHFIWLIYKDRQIGYCESCDKYLIDNISRSHTRGHSPLG